MNDIVGRDNIELTERVISSTRNYELAIMAACYHNNMAVYSYAAAFITNKTNMQTLILQNRNIQITLMVEEVWYDLTHK